MVVKDAQGITVTEDGDSKIVTADAVNNAGLTVSELKAKFENRTVAIVSKSGETLADDARVGTGCKIQVLGQKGNVLSEYTVVVPMDVNGDAAITAQDARLTLRTTALLEKIDAPAVQAANVDGKDGLSAADARKILRKSAHLD